MSKYSRKTANYYGFFRSILYWFFLYLVCFPYLWVFYQMRFEGKENFKKDKKYIISANHISLMDPFLIACALRVRIAYMAKKELFDDIKTRKLLHWLGAFSVNQQKLQLSTMKTVKDIFKTNWNLGIFPQGGIIRYEPISNINKGFAYIAKIAKVDILPIGISGSEKLTFIPFSRKVIVKIGKPISHNLSLDEIVVQWAKQVGELSGYGNAPKNELMVDKTKDKI